jgi:hypothetical protein
MSQLQSALDHLLASRYLTGGFLAALLWDHLTILDQEVHLIWNSRGNLRWMLRFAYVLTRYGCEGFLIFVAYVTSGIRTPSSDLCKSYIITLMIFGTTAIAVSQFVFLLRIYILSDRRRSTLYWLICAFLVQVTIAETFTILTVSDVQKHPELIFAFHGYCVSLQFTKHSTGVLAPLTAFDVFVILFSIYDGLARPRQRNSEVLINLYKGGAAYFLSGTLLLFINFVLLASGHPDNFILITFVDWSIIVALYSRFYFAIEKVYNTKHTLTFIPYYR